MTLDLKQWSILKGNQQANVFFLGLPFIER